VTLPAAHHLAHRAALDHRTPAVRGADQVAAHTYALAHTREAAARRDALQLGQQPVPAGVPREVHPAQRSREPAVVGCHGATGTPEAGVWYGVRTVRGAQGPAAWRRRYVPHAGGRYAGRPRGAHVSTAAHQMRRPTLAWSTPSPHSKRGVSTSRRTRTRSPASGSASTGSIPSALSGEAPVSLTLVSRDVLRRCSSACSRSLAVFSESRSSLSGAPPPRSARGGRGPAAHSATARVNHIFLSVMPTGRAELLRRN
jgi:hypothetical protein